MKLRWPRMRTVALGTLILLTAAWSVTTISADRYREPIRGALERALGRAVEVGEIRFRLLPAPGFTISDVTIGEDPRVGAEPAAYIRTLRAVPSIPALLSRRLAFSSIDLEDASLNLARVDRAESGVQWNFSGLMRASVLAAFPSVHMRDGRINFKFGETKSIFYLLNTDIDLWPPSSARDPWTVRIRAEPARTDRPARGFGSLIARGEWQQRDSSLQLNVRLEKSELAEIFTLFEGVESGIHGEISGDAHLAGPIWRLGLEGRVAVSDVHAWDQSPPGGRALPIFLRGTINAPGQVIELRATTAGGQSPIDVRYRVADYLGRPRWGVTAYFSSLPMEPVLDIARHLGFSVPVDLSFKGTAQGAIGYSMPNGLPRMDGEVRVADSTLAVPGAPPLRVAGADIKFSGSRISLAPTVIANEKDETASVEGSYDIGTAQLQAELASDGMAISSLRKQIPLSGVPLLLDTIAGTWNGKLHYSSEPAGWTGDVRIEDADVPFEAFAQPLHVISADVTLNAADIAMRHLNLSIGDIRAQGEYRYQAASARPHRFQVTVPDVDADAIEKVLMPALRRGNLLTYAFNFGRMPEPDWLRNMRADGTFQIGTLRLNDIVFSQVRTRLIWDGSQVRLSGLKSQYEDAIFDGSGSIDLRQRQPEYRLSGKISGVQWRSGTVNAEGTLTTSGIATELLSNLRAEGSFHGTAIDLTPLDNYDSVDGCFEWIWDARNPRLRLTQLSMMTDGETFLGSGETQSDGQLLLQLSDGTRQIQASGALLRGSGMRLIGQ